MKSTSITDYILKLEKLNEESRTKIEQLKSLFIKTDGERVAALKRLRQCEEEKVLLEYENMLQYAEEEASDDEDFFVSRNVELTDAFDKLVQEEENEFKQAVYEKAANIIYRLDFKVKYGEQLAHLPGIGKGIIRKINEFLETGNFSHRPKK